MVSLSLQGALGLFFVASNFCSAFSPSTTTRASPSPPSCAVRMSPTTDDAGCSDGGEITGAIASTRRSFLGQSAALSLGALTATQLTPGTGGSAEAVGPVKISLKNPQYSAAPCPPSKPIPGEKAMKGMRGLCVTVKADLEGPPEKVSRHHNPSSSFLIILILLICSCIVSFASFRISKR